MGGQPQPERGADQPPQLLLRDALGPLLGEKAAERVVESQAGRHRGAGGGRRGSTEAEGPASALAEVVGPAPERVGEVGDDHSARAAGPEQRADHDAYQAAEGHVLDAEDADLPADGRQEVVEDGDRDREGGLAERERSGPGRVRGDQDRDRQHRPEDRLVAPDHEDERAA